MAQPPFWKNLGGAALALVVLAGCRAPLANQSLQPLQPIQAWARGKALVTQSQGGLSATVAFQSAGVGVWQFQVQVANAGEQPVLVTPEKIQCFWSEDPAAGLADREALALDPEPLIRTLAAQEAEEASKRANESAFHALFGVVDLVDSLANTSKRTVAENRAVNQERREMHRDMNDSEQRSQQRSTDLANERQELEIGFLRRTTLAPGQEVRGKVIVHADGPRARKVRLRVPVEPAVFDFDFGPQ